MNEPFCTRCGDELFEDDDRAVYWPSEQVLCNHCQEEVDFDGLEDDNCFDDLDGFGIEEMLDTEMMDQEDIDEIWDKYILTSTSGAKLTPWLPLLSLPYTQNV